MDQISLPFRIALVALLAVLVVWFAVLRPKAGGEAASAPSTPTPAATAPGTAGLAKDVGKAKDAVAASKAAADRAEGAANAVGSSAAKPAATAAKPAAAAPKAAAPKPVKPAKPGLADDAAPGDPSRPLLADVDAGKVVVVLFWNDEASDDRATRTALRSIDLHHGKVVASAIPISDVGRYEAITRGAQVLESPTILVIGAGGKARAITGYTQTGEIDQAVSDIGGTGFAIHKAFTLTGFAKVADDTCKDFGYVVDQKADPPTTVAALSKTLGVADEAMAASSARLQHTPARTGDERALKSAMVAFVKKDSGWAADARAKLKAGQPAANVFLALRQLEEDGNDGYIAAAKKLRARGCYAND